MLKAIKAMKAELPKVVANESKNFFLSSFKNQGFTNTGPVPWQEVKRRLPGAPVNKKDPGAKTRAILQGKGSGQLRRAVTNSIQSATFDLITLRVKVPYADYLNDGTSKMPQRQFIGNSQVLEDQHRKTITDHFNKAFKV